MVKTILQLLFILPMILVDIIVGTILLIVLLIVMLFKKEEILNDRKT